MMMCVLIVVPIGKEMGIAVTDTQKNYKDTLHSLYCLAMVEILESISVSIWLVLIVGLITLLSAIAVWIYIDISPSFFQMVSSIGILIIGVSFLTYKLCIKKENCG